MARGVGGKTGAAAAGRGRFDIRFDIRFDVSVTSGRDRPSQGDRGPRFEASPTVRITGDEPVGRSMKTVHVNRLCENHALFPSARRATAMNPPLMNLTAPQLSGDATLWFSAYAFGWGYCAFALPAETVREKLGAANETPKQLMLAFELGKRRLLQAVEQKVLPITGERITLSSADL
ncbi:MULTISPECIES: hypothetical protein [Burkholderiaceae]|uniref:hypothetical protein n=1 Tax=Burkholderiaceae TaxID=119060 RepID=UPI001F0444E1|nr:MULTISPECIES: hypothetical protein [Burkholderiaceae]